ncbi:MAG: hypothetical protein HYX34_14935 [Actinobacteria bacterium]|nr:hypothetical protein [Actinomycetota bacterium]
MTCHKTISRVALGVSAAVMAMAPAGRLAARAGPSATSSSNGAESYLPSSRPDGWIEYRGSLVGQLDVPAGPPVLVPGMRDAAGSCVFDDTQMVQPGEVGVFSEDVAFNPATCDRKVITVRLTPAASARLDRLQALSEASGTTLTVSGSMAHTRGR